MNSPRRELPAGRHWVAVFALLSLAIMAGGLTYYRYEQDYIRREKYQDLAAIADLKVRQILDWRRERLGDAGAMVRSPFLRQAIANWLQDPRKPGLQMILLEQFKIVQEGYAYENVLLVAPDGRILLSLRPDQAPLSPAGKQALEAAVAGRQAVLSDLFRCPQDNLVWMDVAAPVLDHQGRTLAVVVLRANAEKFLFPLVQFWPTPSRTAETLLVKVEGADVLFLNELRHREKTAFSLREPLTRTELPAVQAVLGKQGMFAGKDYRGVEVLADLRPVPQSPWFMVAKVDADEILAEARYRAGITTFGVVIFILLTAAVTAYGYRRRQAKLYQDLYQTEREQRQAQEEFRTILYSIGEAVITTDTKGLVKQMNRVAERLTGWLEAEAQGRPNEEIFYILNEETRSPAKNPVDCVLREGQVVGLANHTLLIARDGAEHPIADSGAPIQDESGAVMGAVLVFRDQTQERAAKKALRESEERFRIAAETTNDLIYEWDLKQNLQWSDRIDEMLGYDPAEFSRTLDGWMESVHPEDIDHVKASIKAHLEGRVPYIEEYRIRRKDGVYRWWTARGDALMSPDGTPVRWFGTVTDITESKRAEESLRKRTAELEFANRELEAFSYSVSHDLKAPVRAIQGFSRMLMADHADKLDAEAFRLLQVITTNTKLMHHLIDDLLALSRLGRVQIRKSVINLTAITNKFFEKLRPQAPERNLQLRLGDLPPGLGDQSLLYQVMENLLANAAKFTKSRKTAVIEVGGRTEGKENIYFVKDNGAGFDERYVDNLFRPFQRLHGGEEYEGTGVGLAIVQRIIQRHGGRVWAEGKVGEGATFYFALPKNEG